ncbi:MAG: gliding motility-associated C-terminal domain-containing protein [Bacteroidales bacterium]|nr:gliding motility-associated C-terminal domain-containing protein [Bacteroidales bacterium]
MVILFLTVTLSYVNAQLSSPQEHVSLPAEYASNPGTDSVFIFNRPVYNSTMTIPLKATSADLTPGWNFVWSVYDMTTLTYSIIPKADTGTSSTIDTISVSSGYQVIITKGSISDTFRICILLNDFYVMITNKDDYGEVMYYDRDCQSVTLKSDTVVFPLWYPEPGTDNRIHINNKYAFDWEADNEQSEAPRGGFIGGVDNPPYKDTWYTVTVTDNFKLSRSDSIFCPAIKSKPSLGTPEYVTLNDPVEYPGKLYKYYYDTTDVLENRSAPGKYRFDFSGSENAVWYKIKFGDGQMYEAESDSDKIVHEYQLPGKYTATLITQSPAPFGCIDSSQVENVIELAVANFELPNVFSPNGDGNNDVAKLYIDNNVFRSNDVSVFIIELTIFNRIGKKVHEYAGNIRDWEGWDGNIMGSNRQAPDGVYFYCLTRYFYGYPEGSSEMSYLKDEDRGFIHLYRE